MDKHIRRSIALILTFILITAFLPSLNVQAASKNADQKAITKQLNNYLKAVKKYDTKKMIKYGGNSTTKWYYWTNKKMAKIARTVNKDCFNYKIKSVNIKGKSATVKVKYTYYDCKDELDHALKDMVNWYWVYSDASSDEMYNKIAEYFYEYYDFDEETYDDEYLEYSCTFYFTKKDGKWYISRIPKKFHNAMDSGTISRMDYFKKNINKYLF